ncbi:MAG: chemotaxis response regulator protein-glutamate methylesterase [Lachnospiraceae bacterium]
MKKILVVDDSALMRRMMCDIIESDERFQVADKAVNGLEALDFITKNTYDAVVLDVNMPKMTGLQLLEELQKRKIQAKVVMASTDTAEGAKVTLDALELGAIDFIHKPENAFALKEESFRKKLLRILEAVCESRACNFGRTPSPDEAQTTRKVVELAKKHSGSSGGSKIIALASSTGGPKALHSVIPMLPKNLKCPVVLVQHMPAGFTKSLAERLDSLSEVKVSEAVDGEVLEAGHVYIARGGNHMNVDMKAGGKYVIRYSDEPSREGVKPCANYMYESLINSKYDEIICVVLTGMGADGTKGIKNLKEKKKVHVIAQEQSTCAVYGMPRSVVNAGLADQIVPLEQIAQEIILNAGVK